MSVGYYRVEYDGQFERLLQLQLLKDHTEFHPHTRAKLLDDYFSFAESGLEYLF